MFVMAELHLLTHANSTVLNVHVCCQIISSSCVSWQLCCDPVISSCSGCCAVGCYVEWGLVLLSVQFAVS